MLVTADCCSLTNGRSLTTLLGLLKVQTYMWLAHSHTKWSLLSIPLYSSILHTRTTHTHSDQLEGNQHHYQLCHHHMGPTTSQLQSVLTRRSNRQHTSVWGHTTGWCDRTDHIHCGRAELIPKLQHWCIFEIQFGTGKQCNSDLSDTRERWECREYHVTSGHASIAQWSIVQCSAICIMHCARQYIVHLYTYNIYSATSGYLCKNVLGWMGLSQINKDIH